MGFEQFRGSIVYDFSTRHGGVSKGVYSSLNLSFSTGDERDAVMENYRIWCAGLGVDPAKTVLLSQAHTTNVIRVDASNCGQGLLRSRPQEVDGMVTDCKGVALVTYHADCVPLYFYDPVSKAIGLAHAGWRGTVGAMAAAVVRKMNREFGSVPEDLYTRIGPCISQTYFECDSDVVDAVAKMPMWAVGGAGSGPAEGGMTPYSGETARKVPGYSLCLPPDICYYDEENEKYHVSLSRLNRAVMLHAGIPADHIDMADTCTYEHDELYFSHRRQGPMRGGQAALLMMKE